MVNNALLTTAILTSVFDGSPIQASGHPEQYKANNKEIERLASDGSLNQSPEEQAKLNALLEQQRSILDIMGGRFSKILHDTAPAIIRNIK